MSFRRRITLVSAAAVAIAVVLASLLTYLLTSHQLRGQVDTQLRNRADSLRFVAANPARRDLAARCSISSNGQDSGQAQAAAAARALRAAPCATCRRCPTRCAATSSSSTPAGHVLFRSANVTLPVDARTRALAANAGPRFFHDARVNGIHLRILAEHVAPMRAVQVAQPLTEVDNLLAHLRLILALLDVGGIALAALLGRLVAGAAVLPLKRLTQATEHVALTQDLSGRIQPVGRR